MSHTEAPLERADYSRIVTNYLAAQGWQLADPDRLADQIWQDAGTRGLAGPTTVKALQNQVWQRYAGILHEACRDADRERREQAWSELHRWLERQARQLTSDPAEQIALAQTAVIGLQRRLSQTPLKAPRALWAYALQAMRSALIDEHRRRTAIMRGDGRELSLEDLGEAAADGEGSEWDEEISLREEGERSVEDSVANEQVRQQLRAFFQQHLPTDLQREVAEAHFLDGLEPQAIAQLLGKRPHEIRMVKARIVHTLRNLTPGDRQKLLSVLKAAHDERS